MAWQPGLPHAEGAYLRASDWLLRQGAAADIGEAERQHLGFHLRQFVDAMSPSLLLLCNPEALRRATHVVIDVRALNRMLELGRPKYVRIV
jgi:polyhydroxyalkanoate synthase